MKSQCVPNNQFGQVAKPTSVWRCFRCSATDHLVADCPIDRHTDFYSDRAEKDSSIDGSKGTVKSPNSEVPQSESRARGRETDRDCRRDCSFSKPRASLCSEDDGCVDHSDLTHHRSDNGLYTYIVAHDVELKCLVDSGAAENCLSLDSFNKIDEDIRPQMAETLKKLSGAGSQEIQVHGRVSLPVLVGKTTHMVDF